MSYRAMQTLWLARRALWLATTIDVCMQIAKIKECGRVHLKVVQILGQLDGHCVLQ